MGKYVKSHYNSECSEGIRPSIDHLSQPIRNIVRGCLCSLETRLRAEVVLKAVYELTGP